MKELFMKILITGGCGFIGSNAALSFAQQGYEVVLLDNMSRRGSEENRMSYACLSNVRLASWMVGCPNE